MKKMPRKEVAALLVVGLVFTSVLGWAQGRPLPPADVAVWMLTFAVGGLLCLGAFRNVRLVRRAESGEAGGVARVFVNEVEVGSLPAAQYARVVRDAWSTKGLYALQAINLGCVALRAVVAVVRFIPWVWFLALAAAAVFAPEGLREFFAHALTGSPTQLVEAVRQALSGGALISVFACGMSAAFGVERFGYVNRFDEVISQRIRKLLEVPAEGSMRVLVVRFVRGDVQ